MAKLRRPGASKWLPAKPGIKEHATDGHNSVFAVPRVWTDHGGLIGTNQPTQHEHFDVLGRQMMKDVQHALPSLSRAAQTETARAKIVTKKIRAICTFCGEMGSKVNPDDMMCKDAEACMKRRVTWG